MSRAGLRWLTLAALALTLSGCARSAPPTGAAPPVQGSQESNDRSIADFYRGKTVRVIVGFSPGGGYDTYTRLIARYLGNYIPGNPSVVVENMPGAGSMVAANQVYNTLSKDGTVIGNIAGTLVLEQLFRTDGVQFDASRFRYLNVPVRETYAMVVHSRTGITSIQEITGPNGKPVVLAGIPGTGVEQGALLMREALGGNIKVVSGYEGTSVVRLAIEGGELDGFVNSWQSIKITNLDDVVNGNWVVLADINEQPTRDMPAHPPLLKDIGQTEEQRQLVRLGLLYPNQIGKVYVAAPEVPEPRAAALENAFKQVFADKAFQEEAEKTRLELDPLWSEEIKTIVANILNTPEDTRAKLQRILKP